VFWPLLNIAVEFTAEELENAIVAPNRVLEDLHIPLLRVSLYLLPPKMCLQLNASIMANDILVTGFCRQIRHFRSSPVFS
jgi:hypothetical protein